VCGRFTSSQRREAIGERFEVAVPDTYQHRFNLAPQQRALIVRERDDEREAVMAKWGLLPHWAKDTKVAFKMINARAETLTEKPAYRSLLSRHRCLIPADGFYEWRVGSDGKKHPIHFHLPEYELFAFAGLWTSRTDEETGEILESCTIVTTTPNERVVPVHDRMPVILPAGPSPINGGSAARLRLRRACPRARPATVRPRRRTKVFPAAGAHVAFPRFSDRGCRDLLETRRAARSAFCREVRGQSGLNAASEQPVALAPLSRANDRDRHQPVHP
jgi:putative SOS response-associated peptidase YedK